MQTGGAWAYSDGNAGAAYPSFFNEIDELDVHVNWDAVGQRNWSSVTTAKSAEFLVADTYPWNSIRAIGCQTEVMAQQVARILENFEHKPSVLIKPDWYY
jgi:hypothetical protein